MANASTTVDDSKPSQAPERRILYYAIAAAVFIVACALAYRIVTAEGNLDVEGSADGLSVKITQVAEAERTIESANVELKAAQQQLTEAKAQLTTRETALMRAEAELKQKEQRIQELLQKLAPPSGAPAPSKPTLSDARAELEKLQAQVPARVLVAPTSTDALEQRVLKIDDLQRKLAKTNESLKQ
jgi:chromosome segregation ATPase